MKKLLFTTGLIFAFVLEGFSQSDKLDGYKKSTSEKKTTTKKYDMKGVEGSKPGGDSRNIGVPCSSPSKISSSPKISSSKSIGPPISSSSPKKPAPSSQASTPVHNPDTTHITNR